MTISKLLFSIGIVASITTFSSEIVCSEAEISTASLEFENLFEDDLLIATPTELKMTYSEGNFAQFKLNFLTTRNSSGYIWFLTKEDGSLIYCFPFKTSEDGSITFESEKIEERRSILLDQVRQGEAFGSALLDIGRKTVTLDTVTPFPNIYEIGQRGLLCLSTKLPYPVVHADIKGLNPGEKLSIQIEGRVLEVVANKNGEITADLFTDKVIKHEPIELKFITSIEEQTVVFEKKEAGTMYKAKITL